MDDGGSCAVLICVFVFAALFVNSDKAANESATKYQCLPSWRPAMPRAWAAALNIARFSSFNSVIHVAM